MFPCMFGITIIKASYVVFVKIRATLVIMEKRTMIPNMHLIVGYKLLGFSRNQFI